MHPEYQDALNLLPSAFNVRINSLTTSVLVRDSCSQYPSNISCSALDMRTIKTLLFFRLGIVLTWIRSGYTLTRI